MTQSEFLKRWIMHYVQPEYFYIPWSGQKMGAVKFKIILDNTPYDSINNCYVAFYIREKTSGKYVEIDSSKTFPTGKVKDYSEYAPGTVVTETPLFNWVTNEKTIRLPYGTYEYVEYLCNFGCIVKQPITFTVSSSMQTVEVHHPACYVSTGIDQWYSNTYTVSATTTDVDDATLVATKVNDGIDNSTLYVGSSGFIGCNADGVAGFWDYAGTWISGECVTKLMGILIYPHYKIIANTTGINLTYSYEILDRSNGFSGDLYLIKVDYAANSIVRFEHEENPGNTISDRLSTWYKQNGNASSFPYAPAKLTRNLYRKTLSLKHKYVQVSMGNELAEDYEWYYRQNNTLRSSQGYRTIADNNSALDDGYQAFKNIDFRGNVISASESGGIYDVTLTSNFHYPTVTVTDIGSFTKGTDSAYSVDLNSGALTLTTRNVYTSTFHKGYYDDDYWDSGSEYYPNRTNTITTYESKWHFTGPDILITVDNYAYAGRAFNVESLEYTTYDTQQEVINLPSWNYTDHNPDIRPGTSQTYQRDITTTTSSDLLYTWENNRTYTDKSSYLPIRYILHNTHISDNIQTTLAHSQYDVPYFNKISVRPEQYTGCDKSKMAEFYDIQFCRQQRTAYLTYIVP